MVPLADLWLPILLSAVFVFVASAIVHMVLPIHRKDYVKLPNEDEVRSAFEEVPPGDYLFPCAEDPSQQHSDEMKEKWATGPTGTVTVMPAGMPSLAKNLTQWFVYLVVINVFVAYVTGRALAPDSHYLGVFRIAGTVAILAYAGAEPTMSIWWKRSWGTTLRNVFDAVVYGLLTAGVFGWLWPGA